MHVPQIIFIIIFSVSLLIAAHDHGKPKDNVFNDFWTKLISLAIIVGLLVWGGFFSH